MKKLLYLSTIFMLLLFFIFTNIMKGGIKIQVIELPSRAFNLPADQLSCAQTVGDFNGDGKYNYFSEKGEMLMPKKSAYHVGLTGKVPRGLAEFRPYRENPVFKGMDNSWDKYIRERGWIIFEDGLYHLWYTGYPKKRELHQLGYATSRDGINWTRYDKNPLVKDSWVEDMCVVKDGDIYYMMAEGFHDWAHLLISKDRINWTEKGSIIIRNPDGTIIADPSKPTSHAGTPVLLKEGDTWYLFFERSDEAVWLAAATDSTLLNWTKVQVEPVLSPGPEAYDSVAIASDCIRKINGIYYMYYHATAKDPWDDWCVCLATSNDLIHWEKYEHNPIGYYGDAPVLVFNGKEYLLFVTDSAKEMKLYYPIEKIPFPDR